MSLLILACAVHHCARKGVKNVFSDVINIQKHKWPLLLKMLGWPVWFPTPQLRKGKLLLSLGKQVKLFHALWHTIFWLNRGLRVYFDLYAPNFPKKYLKVLIVPKYFGGLFLKLNLCTLPLLLRQNAPYFRSKEVWGYNLICVRQIYQNKYLKVLVTLSPSTV